MAADTYLTIHGLYHLQFQAVQVTIGGLDCGDFAVSSAGAAVVPLTSTLTIAFIASLDGYEGEQAVSITVNDGVHSNTYTIPCVVGVGYRSRGQTLRAVSADDLKSPSGPAFGKMRRDFQVGAALVNCINAGISFGSDFTNTLPASLRVVYTDPSTELDGITMFNGVYWGDVVAPNDFDNMVCWEVTRPVPATVAGLTAFMESQER